MINARMLHVMEIMHRHVCLSTHSHIIAKQHFGDITSIIVVSVQLANTETVTPSHSSIYLIKIHLHFFIFVCDILLWYTNYKGGRAFNHNYRVRQ